jgi:hypothetical protein
MEEEKRFDKKFHEEVLGGLLCHWLALWKLMFGWKSSKKFMVLGIPKVSLNQVSNEHTSNSPKDQCIFRNVFIRLKHEKLKL